MLRSLCLAALVSVPTLAHAADLHVGTGQTWSTIQAAVDAAQNNDTIVVHAGRYVGQVVVDDVTIDALTIKAYGQDTVTIAAPTSVVNTIIANTVNLKLKNITIEAPYHASPAPRGIAFISQTGSTAQTFTLGLCNVTVTGDDLSGSAGVACGVGLNDTLVLRGDNVSFLDLATDLTTSCAVGPEWTEEWEFCSGW